MNKLITRNPILRFKLGRKILKYQLGKELQRQHRYMAAFGPAGPIVSTLVSGSRYLGPLGAIGSPLATMRKTDEAFDAAYDLRHSDKKSMSELFDSAYGKMKPVYYETKNSEGKVIESGYMVNGVKVSNRTSKGKNGQTSSSKRGRVNTSNSLTENNFWVDMDGRVHKIAENNQLRSFGNIYSEDYLRPIEEYFGVKSPNSSNKISTETGLTPTTYTGTVWDYLNSKAKNFGDWTTNNKGNKFFTITNDDGSKVNVFGNGLMYDMAGNLIGTISEQEVRNASQRGRTQVRQSQNELQPVDINYTVGLPSKSTNTRSSKSVSSSFGQAFKNARKAGKQIFTLNGKLYTTNLRGESSSKQPIINVPPTQFFNANIETPDFSNVDLGISTQTVNAPTSTYNRKDVRNFLRLRGFNPYNFTGELRWALRNVINGTADDYQKQLVSLMGL